LKLEKNTYFTDNITVYPFPWFRPLSQPRQPQNSYGPNFGHASRQPPGATMFFAAAAFAHIRGSSASPSRREKYRRLSMISAQRGPVLDLNFRETIFTGSLYFT